MKIFTIVPKFTFNFSLYLVYYYFENFFEIIYVVCILFISPKLKNFNVHFLKSLTVLEFCVNFYELSGINFHEFLFAFLNLS